LSPLLEHNRSNADIAESTRLTLTGHSEAFTRLAYGSH
jgi:hypothetical protein